MPLDRIRTA